MSQLERLQMNRNAGLTAALAIVVLFSANPIGAQPLASADAAATGAARTVEAPAGSGFSFVSSVTIADDAASGQGTLTRLVRDVGSDYKNFFSVETALWLGGGGGAALAVHAADQEIKDAAADATDTLPGGAIYGSQYLQLPVAVAWWAIASAAGSERHAETGRDLLRAQISVASWTYGIKLVADRTRPNGDSHSFPSGHASASFATAMVLQTHYGWKVGLPAFLAAGYTAASRVADNQHWTSDVVFGAFLGMACARTVTIKYRESRVSIAPVAVPKGGAVLVSVLRPGD